MLLVGETAVKLNLLGDDFARQLVGVVDGAVRAANSSLQRLGADVRPIDLQIDETRARSAISELGRGVAPIITPTVDGAAAAGELAEFGKFIEPVIQPFVDGEKARGEIGDLTKAWDATMTVIVDDAAARAARSDLERPIEPTFQPQPGGGAAAASGGGGGGGGAGLLGGLGVAGINPGVAAGVLSVAGLVALTKAGADYQSVLTQIRTAATAIPEDAIKNAEALERLRPTVTALGNDLELPGQSASDAADAINVLVRANYDLDDAMTTARSALQLAIVTQTDAASSTTLLTDVMAASGLGIKDTQFAIDRLAMSEILGKGKVADLAESVKYAGTGFKALYGDTLTSRDGFEQMLGTLLVFDQAGVRGSLAGTMLNRMLTDLATPTGKAQTQLDQLTKRINEMNPAFLKGGSITRDFEGNVRPVPEIIKNLSIATADMTTAQKDAAIQTALGEKAFEGLSKEQRDAALATIFTTNGLRAFQVMQGQAADSTDNFVAKLHGADGAGKKLAEGSASDLSKAIENMGSTMETVSNNAVEVFSPAITTALTGVTSGVALVGDALVGQGPSGALAREKIAGYAAELGGIITGIVGPDKIARIQGLLGQLSEGFNSAFAAVKAIVETAITVIMDLWGRLGPTLLDGISNAFDAIIQVVSGGFTIMKGIFDVITSILHGDWSGLWDGLKEIVRGAWAVINGIIDAAWNVIRTSFGVALGLISALWSTGWHALHTLFVDVWTGVKHAVSSGIDDVVGFLKSLPGKAVTAVGNVGSTLLAAGKSLLEGFKKGAEEIWKTVTSWLGTLGGLAVSAIGSLAGKLTDAGRSLLKGMRTGAEEVWNSFYAWLKTLPGKAVDAVASIPGKIGGALGDGLGWVGKKVTGHAMGGFFDRATLGVFGEDGPEVILPLSKPDRMRELLSMPEVSSALGQSGALTATTVQDSGGTLRLEIDTSWVAKIVDALTRLTDQLTAAMSRAVGTMASTAEKIDTFTYKVGAGLDESSNATTAAVTEFTYKVGAGLEENARTTTATVAQFAYQVGAGLDETAKAVTAAVSQFSYVVGKGAYANGAVVDTPTFGLFGEAGPEAILPLSKPDKLRRILADQRVAAAVFGGDGAVVGELRRLRSDVGALQANTTYVSVPNEALVHIYARAQQREVEARLRARGIRR